MTSPSLQPSQAGFTLTEVMVVVAMIGVVTSMTISVTSKPSAANAANALSTLFRQVQQAAVAGGPVRTDVAVALGSTVRSRLIVRTVNGEAKLVAQTLQEGPEGTLTATWNDGIEYKIPRGMVWCSDASAASKEQCQQSGFGSTVAVFTCKPNGTCCGTSTGSQCLPNGVAIWGVELSPRRVLMGNTGVSIQCGWSTCAGS